MHYVYKDNPKKALVLIKLAYQKGWNFHVIPNNDTPSIEEFLKIHPLDRFANVNFIGSIQEISLGTIENNSSSFIECFNYICDFTCPNCEKVPKARAHLCPYKVDILGDTESLCECCNHCYNNCNKML